MSILLYNIISVSFFILSFFHVYYALAPAVSRLLYHNFVQFVRAFAFITKTIFIHTYLIYVCSHTATYKWYVTIPIYTHVRRAYIYYFVGDVWYGVKTGVISNSKCAMRDDDDSKRKNVWLKIRKKRTRKLQMEF